MGRKRLAIALVVVVAAGINLVQFHSIDASRTQYAALDRLPTSDLIATGLEDEQLARAYQLYLSLAEIAPGSHVILSTSGILSIPDVRDMVLSFGRATEVETREYDDDAGDLLASDTFQSGPSNPHTGASGVGDIGGLKGVVWQIVTGDCPSTVDGAREFAIVQSRVEGETFIFLAETCLLPADVMGAP